jgi:uncharacterized protein YsxB (DUF464 family)
MIQAVMVLDRGGLLKSCRVSGHGGAGRRGSDVVCAAVSVLIRTAVQVLSGREGISLRGAVPGRGDFWIETDSAAGAREFLAGAGAFLAEGLLSVAREFPDHCRVIIERVE